MKVEKGNTEEWRPVGGRHVTSWGGEAGNCCSVIHLLHEHGHRARLAQVRPCQGGEGKENIKYINNESKQMAPNHRTL